MVSVEALLSGLVGAVIGAVIGGLLTFAVQRDDRNHRETMAARVVFIEATTNETFLEALIDGLVAGPILDVAWSANSNLLVGRLSEAEVRTLMLAYLFVPACEDIRRQFVAGAAMTVDNRNVLASTHNDFIDARLLLRLHAYGPLSEPHVSSASGAT